MDATNRPVDFATLEEAVFGCGRAFGFVLTEALALDLEQKKAICERLTLNKGDARFTGPDAICIHGVVNGILATMFKPGN